MIIFFFSIAFAANKGSRPVDENPLKNHDITETTYWNITKLLFNITETLQQSNHLIIYIDNNIEFQNTSTDIKQTQRNNVLTDSDTILDEVLESVKIHIYMFMAKGIANIFATLFSTTIIVHFWRTTGRYDIIPSQVPPRPPPPSLQSEPFIVSSETYI